MIRRALAALALGGLLFIIVPGFFQTLGARQSKTVSPELIERYRQTLSTDQGNLTLHYLLGVALLQDNQNKTAMAELQTAYPAYQGSVEAHYNLAIAALRLGDLGSAEIFLEQAEALGAKDMSEIYPVADLYFNMALKSQETGNANEAIRYFHKVLAFAPQRYEVYRQLGDLHAHRKDTDLAIKSFRTYLEQFPDDPVSRDYLFALEFNRAQDLLAINDLANAAVGFSAAMKILPDSPTAFYYLGYIAYVQQQPGQALELLNQAFSGADESLRQTIRPLLYNTALALRQAGQSEMALGAVSMLADREGTSFNEVFLAGTLNLDLGHHRAAEEYLQRAVTLDPSHQGAKQNLLTAELGAFDEWLSTAAIKLREEEFDAADAALHHAGKLQPQSTRVTSFRNRLDQLRRAKAAACFSDAQTALEGGDFIMAAAQAKSGLTIQPGNAAGLALRDQINAALAVDLNSLIAEAVLALQSADWQKATEIYTRVLAVAPQHPAALAGRDQTMHARQQQSLTLLEDGQTALNVGQTEQAMHAFKQLLAMQPDHQQALEGLQAVEQMRANRVDEFLLKGRQARGRNHFQEARQWFNRAQAVDASSRAEQELAQLERLIRQQADKLTLQAEQASLNSAYKQARELFTQALSLVPEHSSAIAGRQTLEAHINEVMNKLLLRATDAQRQADYAAALNAYRTVLDLAPDNHEALDGVKMSREGQAAELDNLVKQGQEALANGELAEAEQYLSKALRQDAYHKEAQQLRQRLEQVRQTGAQPGDEHKLYLQGVAYYTQGKYTEAIKTWEIVLLLDPGHEKSSQNILKTKRKMRQIEEFSGG